MKKKHRELFQEFLDAMNVQHERTNFMVRLDNLKKEVIKVLDINNN